MSSVATNKGSAVPAAVVRDVLTQPVRWKGAQRIDPGERRDRLKSLSSGPSDLLACNISRGFVLPLRGIYDEADIERAFSPYIFLKEQHLSEMRALKARSIPAQGEALGSGAGDKDKGYKPAR